MRDPGHYLGFDVFLDRSPLLAMLGRAGGEELAQVARRDIGDDSAGIDCVIVVDDLDVVSPTGSISVEWCVDLLSSMDA